MSDSFTSPLVFGNDQETTTPVEYKGKNYELREPTADVAAKFVNARVKAIIVRDGSIAGINDPADLQFLLVSGCLFDEEGKRVQVSTLRTWNGVFIGKLYERALDVGNLRMQDVGFKKLFLEFLEKAEIPLNAKEAKRIINEMEGGSKYNAIVNFLKQEDAEEEAKN